MYRDPDGIGIECDSCPHHRGFGFVTYRKTPALLSAALLDGRNRHLFRSGNTSYHVNIHHTQDAGVRRNTIHASKSCPALTPPRMEVNDLQMNPSMSRVQMRHILAAALVSAKSKQCPPFNLSLVRDHIKWLMPTWTIADTPFATFRELCSFFEAEGCATLMPYSEFMNLLHVALSTVHVGKHTYMTTHADFIYNQKHRKIMWHVERARYRHNNKHF